MKNFGKYLLLLLTFLSIGEVSAFNFPASEVKEDKFPAEELRAAGFSFYALRENPFQEIPDLSEPSFFPLHSVIPYGFDLFVVPSEAAAHFFIRDIRRNLSQQLFPKHFFL
ncbi:hypothetical protein SAMN06296241_1025 [Salinimicrobium sediminis]|uniref:Uncharacterized protein n=1 Tax=Salinimicrobium sediminis TaxID=1343891 RepID=A0A285X2B1_9FLAO|nr:hypothetical protein [Salinimicrobium sediminis]SOC79500.1 hypothetical protein SAMN06296241_1025 [Salinimicrobium sediminis]